MVRIPKPDKGLIKALEDAGALNPERTRDLVEQLAERVGLPVEVVMGVLETMLQEAKDKAEKPNEPNKPQRPPQHDESLEAGLAAGLDIPTAMVLSETDPSGCGWSCGEILALLVVLVCLIYGLARLF